MKAMAGLLTIGLVAVTGWSSRGARGPDAFVKDAQSTQSQPTQANETGGRQPVLVELFTSEGCSSCPPADALLAGLDRVQPIASAEVIVLEEHVDYWDQQGWKDPFSSSEWTYRQNDYAGSLHTGSSYTPEMVVDGIQGFTGSRGPAAKNAIEKAALLKKGRVVISEASPVQGRSVAFKIDVEKLPNATPKDTPQVLLGITETGLHSSVKGGENAGHELQHAAVLRELKVVGALSKNGQDGFSTEPTVKLDSNWNVANLRVVVFVQEKKSRRVLGAAEMRLRQQEALR